MNDGIMDVLGIYRSDRVTQSHPATLRHFVTTTPNSKPYIHFLLPLLLLTSCLSKQTESLPISQEKLVAVLLDVHVAESALALQQGGVKKDSLANLFYDQVSEIHQVDREVLDTCLAILQRNPELTKEIYEKVVETLEKKRLEK